jgi:hypothetical protein
MAAMQRLVLFLALVAVVAADFPLGNTVTYRRTLKHPIFGQPVSCLVQTASAESGVALAIQQCSQTFCTCVGGSIFRGSSGENVAYAGGLQCSNSFSLLGVDYNRNATANKKEVCSTLHTCYPSYIDCLDNTALGCTQHVLEQCDEQTFRLCNSRSICKIGGNPGGISAGGIFAIVAGVMYGIFFGVALCVTCAGRRKKQPAYEAEGL